MRISDWSSYVCSSDLVAAWLSNSSKKLPCLGSRRWNQANIRLTPVFWAILSTTPVDRATARKPWSPNERSEERRVGKECASTCRSRGSPDHLKKNITTNKIQSTTNTSSSAHRH